MWLENLAQQLRDNEADFIVTDPGTRYPNPAHFYVLRDASFAGQPAENSFGGKLYVSACDRNLYEAANLREVAFGTTNRSKVTCKRCQRTLAYKG